MTDEEYRAAQEQAHTLAEMTRTQGWSDFVGLVQARTMDTRKTLLGGRAPDWDAYLKLTTRLLTAEELLGLPEWAAKVAENERKRRIDNNEPIT